MKKKVLRGKDLMLWISAKVIALSTGCKLSLKVNTQDAASKDDGLWDAPEIGSQGWEATNDSLDTASDSDDIDMVYDKLFELFVAGEPIEVTMGIPSNKSDEGVPTAGWTAGTSVYKGKALITALDREGKKGDNATISITLTGVGALKKETTGTSATESSK
jgi:predicted secreted protein